MCEKRETNEILPKSLVKKIRFLRQKTYHGNGKTQHDRAKGRGAACHEATGAHTPLMLAPYLAAA